MGKDVVPITAGRRSGATNVAPPHLQSIFVDAARAAMGQPMDDDAAWCLDKLVTITFNGERAPITGVLTNIIHHPTTAPAATYLVLDHDEQHRIHLSTVQSIELVKTPLMLTESDDD